jgi:hypothetical protein
MHVSRKVFISVAATAIALFVIADPLGDSHHGLGRHHKVAADLGQTLWAASLILAALAVVLGVVALIQYGQKARHANS